MNRVFLIGRLAADPELRVTSGGTSVCQFRLAVPRRRGATQEADFLPIIAWRQLGETCARYLGKGRQCAVAGAIQTRSYDAQDGTKRYVTEIVADEVEFLGGKPGAKADPEAPAAPDAPRGEFTESEEDELPF